MDRFYKNFILCGEANYYCVLCKEDFEIKANVEKHLRWEQHRHIIKKQEYYYKFKKDRIYKLDEYFYCEICNIVTLNAADHINESEHREAKNSNKIKQRILNVQCDTDGLMKIQNRVITSLQWHGIIDNWCFTCNVLAEKIFSHMTSFKHMIQLIQSETMIKDNQVYRKVGSDRFYCFICFNIVDGKSLETHWTENHNKNIFFKNAEESIKEQLNKDMDTNNNRDKNEIKLIKKVKNEKTCVESQKTVAAKKDDQLTVKILDWLKLDKGKRRAELAKYGRDNFIKLNEGGSKAYCSLCDRWMSAHINIAKQHVGGAFHRGLLEINGLIEKQKHEKPTTECIPYYIFIEVMFGPFEIDGCSFIVINNGISISTLSYMLIRVTDDLKRTIKCFACDTIIDIKDLKEHSKSNEHTNMLYGCTVLPFVGKDGDEFVRQICPGLYHCGYCNKILPFWENLMKHLKCVQHQFQRQKSKLISILCAKLYENPTRSLRDMAEYRRYQVFID